MRRKVFLEADVTITTDYMDPDDLYMPVQTDSADGTLTADDEGALRAVDRFRFVLDDMV